MFVLGLDIGGTKMEGALFSFDHGPRPYLPRKRIPTHRHLGYQQVLKNLIGLIEEILLSNKIKINDLSGIGIGLPGAVDPETLQMKKGNTNLFIGIDLVSDLKKKLNFSDPIKVANDANCFTLAETLLGAGKKYLEKFPKAPEKGTHQLLGIGIILGTGVGGGITICGKMLQGKNGGGGEFGHTLLKSHGLSCYCGRYGCAEQYLSGTALEGAFASRMYSQIKKRPNAQEIFKLADEGDPIAIAVVQDYKNHLRDFLVNLTNSFDPHFFVLGGGVSLQKSLYQQLEESIREECFLPENSPKVFQHVLGDSAGVVGAALLFDHEKKVS